MIEAEQALFGERRNELNGEERIAGGLLVHQSRERGGMAWCAAQRVRNELPQVFPGERRKTNFLHERSCLADGIELPHQRMRGIDFVVPIGADQQQVLHVRLGQQIREQVERRRVEPLQIVEKERQRMFGPREDADEPPKHQLEAALCLLRRKLWDRWLLSDDELQLGDKVDHEPTVRAQRLAKSIAPAGQLGVALAQKRADQALKGLRQRRIGNVALVLIEFAGGEKAARRHQGLVQLIDDGGLADAGIAGDQHQLRLAACDDAIEGGEQGLDLALAPVQFLGNQKPVGRVLLARRERVDAVSMLPRSKAASEVKLQAGRGLVALLGGLGEQLQDDGGERGRDSRHALDRRHRLSGDMAVDPLHGIGRGKRQ